MYKRQIAQAILFWLICFIVVSTGMFIQRKVNVVYFNNVEPMKKITKSSWYTDNNIIIHASGGIDGLSYTNSQEALFSTIAKGGKVIEIDFDYTSDGHLVCYHMKRDIHNNLPEYFTLEDFFNLKIQGKYTPMTAKDVVKIMKQYPDIYISIDTKHNKIEEVVKDIVEICNDEEVLNRFIIQCFYPGDKAKVKKIYNFPEDNFLFARYKHSNDPYDILKICYKENFNVVAASKNDWGKEILELFKSKNIYVFLHTVNRPDEADKMFNNSTYGIYSDFIFNYPTEKN